MQDRDEILQSGRHFPATVTQSADAGKNNPWLPKFRRLAGTGKHAAKIVAAVARELAGFIWDIARHTSASRLA